KGMQPAKRWARLFAMQNVLNDPSYGKLSAAKKLEVIEREGRAWLKDYPAHVKAPEGQSVLFELASTLHRQAQAVKDQKSKPALDLYTEAQKYYGQLAQ